MCNFTFISFVFVERSKSWVELFQSITYQQNMFLVRQKDNHEPEEKTGLLGRSRNSSKQPETSENNISKSIQEKKAIQTQNVATPKIKTAESELITLDDGNQLNGKTFTFKIFNHEIEQCDEIFFPALQINSLYTL
jgi:hypothetical protein